MANDLTSVLAAAGIALACLLGLFWAACILWALLMFALWMKPRARYWHRLIWYRATRRMPRYKGRNEGGWLTFDERRSLQAIEKRLLTKERADR